MNRQAQAVLLFLVGGAMVFAGVTDLSLRYVKAGLRPLLLVAGVVLAGAALATVWYELRATREREHHPHPEPRTSWLLVLPLFALILLAPPALDSYSAMRDGTALPPPVGLPALPAADPLRLTVVDYADRAVYDHGRSLGDRPVEITGFVGFDHDGTVYLIRMLLNCCAADARPVKVGLTGQIPPVLRPDSWLEITGTYTVRQTKDPVNNATIPFIEVKEAKPVPAPAEPYESLG
ncbi:MAG TPA: TIGR03943 family protein [Amycolatopsis sp.]|uniref:TIGR03943 family putative permease subunit n=1 Tax=Amycolatopsis sp. TaxID=37632 RepID=UPI002B48D625|nr:TIGR03943 family protein [Amycolatopsis sp.]HKS45016.1 TIGR03943 family protein [Amycolatopsis sp.]